MATLPKSTSKFNDQLSETFNQNLLSLSLTNKAKNSLEKHWLKPTLLFEKKAKIAQQWYRIIRLYIIILGIFIPALIGIDLSRSRSSKYLTWITVGLSGGLAVAALVDERLNLGEKYRDNREAAECMKNEWWRFCQLTGLYQKYAIHNDAYDIFIDRIDTIKSRAKQSQHGY